MNTKIINFLLIAIALVGGVLLTQEKVEAQLLVVDSKYRIVEVDRAEQRIGVALEDADPKETQTWVYVKPDTKSALRTHHGNGLFRDEILTFNGILDVAAQREGGLFKVHGGRDFDGSINAKTIWF